MQILTLFDSVARDERYYTGWGVSYLVDKRILFDTGEKAKYLLNNMDATGVRPGDIEAVVISHDHWDHQGGLKGLLKKNPGMKVWACPNFSKRFKKGVETSGGRLMEAGNFTKISENIYTTGEIAGRYAFRYMPEEALVLTTSKGITILTGCAHPGIIKMVEHVRQNMPGKIHLVMGGFHLLGRHKGTIEALIGKFRQMGVEKVAAAHCSGKRAMKMFKEAYKENYMDVPAGTAIEV